MSGYRTGYITALDGLPEGQLMADTKHLRQRHNVWFLQYRLPRSLFEKYGTVMYTQTLGTSDLREARYRRDALLSRLRAEGEALTGKSPSGFVRQEVFRQAAIYSDATETLREEGLSLAEVIDPDTLDSLHQDAFKLASGKVEVEEKYRISLREGFADWDQEVSRKSSTASKNRRAVDLYLTFLGRSDIPIHKISRQSARGFIAEQVAAGKTKQTVQNYLGGLSAIFTHCRDYLDSEVGSNPFTGHKLNAKEGVRGYDTFKQGEVSAVFAATESAKGVDFLLPRLGAYSGARIGELVSLKHNDLIEVEGVLCMQVSDGKTGNATRVIPVHSSVIDHVRSQLEVARDEGSCWLFPEVDHVHRADGNTTAYFSQRFSRIRHRAVAGNGRSLGFHSFRTSFITALFRSGVPEQDVVWVSGHERGMTTAYKVYNKGPSIIRLQEIVEAFSLDLLDQ